MHRTTLSIVAVAAAAVAPPAAMPSTAPRATSATSQRDAATLRAERRSLALINRATREMQRDPACRQSLPRETTFSHDAPSQEMQATFSLLRRPAIAQDSVPEDTPALRMLGAGGLYVDWIRMARAANGREFLLAIAQDRGAPAPLSRACLRDRHRRLQRLLADASSRLRRATLRTEARLNRDEQPAGGFPRQEAIYSFERAPDGQIGGAGGGVSLARFRRHGLFGSAQNAVTAPQGISAVTGFVPDGVATIEATFAQRASRGPHRAPEVYPSEIALTLPVQDNVVSFDVEREAQDAFPTTMVWRAADGSVVRTVRDRG